VESLQGIYSAVAGNTDLAALTVQPGTLTPAFSAFVTSYTVNVGAGTDRITIAATPVESRSTVTGTGNHTLSTGANTIRVFVTAPDNASSKTYTVTVHRAVALTPDRYEPNNSPAEAYSLPISFSDNTATIQTTGANFHSGTDGDFYRITLPSGFNYVVSAMLYDLHHNNTENTLTVDAKFAVSTNGADWSDEYDDLMPGNITLLNGGVLLFRVDPYFENNTGAYLLEATVERRQAGVNSDAGLNALSVSDGTLSPTFNTQTTDYTVTVGSSITGIVVSATTSDPNATVSGVGYHTLQAGSTTISLVVTAQNGTTQKTYTLTVNRRTTTGSNASLLSLTVSEGMLLPRFNYFLTQYSVYVRNSVIHVEARTVDEYATVTGTGEYALNTGQNRIDLVVTAENGSTIRTYTIDVIRATVNNNESIIDSPLKVYPNPATDELWVEGIDTDKVTSVNLYSLTGKSTPAPFSAEQGKIRVDLSALRQGFYMLHVTLENGQAITHKVFKK
jgi:hypothetical protein